MTTSSQPDVPEPIDLGPLFTTPQIHTDEHGVHRDESGQEHEAVEVGGEVTYRPVDGGDRETVATWPAPSWATSSDVDSRIGTIDHERRATIGVTDVDGRDVTPSAGCADVPLSTESGVLVRRGGPAILIEGCRLSPHEAGRMAAALSELCDELAVSR